MKEIEKAIASLTKIHRFIVNEAPMRSIQYEEDIANIETALRELQAVNQTGAEALDLLDEICQQHDKYDEIISPLIKKISTGLRK